jgi:hypothetical protein
LQTCLCIVQQLNYNRFSIKSQTSEKKNVFGQLIMIL